MTVKALAEVPALLDLPALPSGSTQSSSFTLDDECVVTKKNSCTHSLMHWIGPCGDPAETVC